MEDPCLRFHPIGGDALKLFSSHLSWETLIKLIKVLGGQTFKFHFHRLKRESNQRRKCLDLQPLNVYEFICFFELRIARGKVPDTSEDVSNCFLWTCVRHLSSGYLWREGNPGRWFKNNLFITIGHFENGLPIWRGGMGEGGGVQKAPAKTGMK